MADEKRETELVRCEGCQEMVRPTVEHTVSMVGVTVVTVHGCPSCGGQKLAFALPAVR